MTESADVAITTSTSIFLITCIVGNCFLCAVVMRNRDMRTPINYLLVNLAVADTIYATFMIPSIILSHNVSHPDGVAGRVLCAFLTGQNLAWVGAYASVFTLIAIATERYFAVVYPYGIERKLTMRKLKVIIPVSWIVGLIVRFPSLLHQNFMRKRNSCISVLPEYWIVQAYWKVYEVYIFLSCILLVVLYSRIIYTLWFKRNDDNILSQQQQGVLKMRKRVTLMVVTVSAIFVMSYGTDTLLHVLEDELGIILGPYAISIAHTVIMFNSAVNPFAYALINQRFRERMKGMICCRSSFFASRVYPVPARQPQDIQITNNIGTQSRNIRGTTPTE